MFSSSFNPFGLFSSSGNNTPAPDKKDNAKDLWKSELIKSTDLAEQTQQLQNSIVLMPDALKVTPGHKKEFKESSESEAFLTKLADTKTLNEAYRYFVKYVEDNKSLYDTVKQNWMTKFVAQNSHVIKTNVTHAQNAVNIIKKALDKIAEKPDNTAFQVYFALSLLKQNVYTLMIKNGATLKKDSVTGLFGSDTLGVLDDLLFHYDFPRGTTAEDLKAHEKMTSAFSNRLS
jgi:hypothetical protein